MKFHGNYYFLSNFYPSPFRTPKGTLVQTVEHAFQACKTRDADEQNMVLNARTPGDAKRAGRRVQLRHDWGKVKLNIMHQLVALKFEQSPALAAKLLLTTGVHLVEDNTWNDTFWGRCNGQGENHLGRILMQVRHSLTLTNPFR